MSSFSFHRTTAHTPNRDMKTSYTHRTKIHTLIQHMLAPADAIPPQRLPQRGRARVERHRQTLADSITVRSAEPRGIGASFSVLLLSEPGTKQQDGTVTKLLATATQSLHRGRQPGGAAPTWSHSDTWWSHRALAFIFTPVYPGESRRIHIHAFKRSHWEPPGTATVCYWRMLGNISE